MAVSALNQLDASHEEWERWSSAAPVSRSVADGRQLRWIHLNGFSFVLSAVGSSIELTNPVGR